MTQLFLTDPPEPGVLREALTWVQASLTGSLATVIGVIAVASLAATMLMGRMELRRGAMVIVGCFLLVGARTIASALVGQGPRQISMVGNSPLRQQSSPPKEYDPYAGASVR